MLLLLSSITIYLLLCWKIFIRSSVSKIPKTCHYCLYTEALSPTFRKAHLHSSEVLSFFSLRFFFAIVASRRRVVIILIYGQECEDDESHCEWICRVRIWMFFKHVESPLDDDREASRKKLARIEVKAPMRTVTHSNSIESLPELIAVNTEQQLQMTLAGKRKKRYRGENESTRTRNKKRNCLSLLILSLLHSLSIISSLLQLFDIEVGLICSSSKAHSIEKAKKKNVK